MQKLARTTSKGQIMVPHEIRRAMGVRPGDRLAFEGNGGEFRVRPVRTKSPFEKYRGIGNPEIPSGGKAVIRWLRERRGE